MLTIQKYTSSNWDELWQVIKPIFRAGETYTYSPNISKEEAFDIWIKSPQETYIAKNEKNQIIGSYYIKPNQSELGSHVCNCGYIVSVNARNKGIATSMCKHSLILAKELNFKAMQFNMVVSTNIGAINLWKKLGFEIIGNLPNAFNSMSKGYVDAVIMYQEL